METKITETYTDAKVCRLCADLPPDGFLFEIACLSLVRFARIFSRKLHLAVHHILPIVSVVGGAISVRPFVTSVRRYEGARAITDRVMVGGVTACKFHVRAFVNFAHVKFSNTVRCKAPSWPTDAELVARRGSAKIEP
eukprot:SAG31_NODE_5656_length_2402_cov_1.374729_1_plen_138_part_00